MEAPRTEDGYVSSGVHGNAGLAEGETRDKPTSKPR